MNLPPRQRKRAATLRRVPKGLVYEEPVLLAPTVTRRPGKVKTLGPVEVEALARNLGVKVAEKKLARMGVKTTSMLMLNAWFWRCHRCGVEGAGKAHECTQVVARREARG